MTPQDWTNRAMWSAFLEAHTARRLAAATSEQDPTVPVVHGRRPRAAGPARQSMHRAAPAASNHAGR